MRPCSQSPARTHRATSSGASWVAKTARGLLNLAEGSSTLAVVRGATAMAFDETQPRANGTLLLDQLGVLRELHGDDVVDRAVGRLSPEIRRELDMILTTTWVPSEVPDTLHRYVAEELGRDPVDVRRELVRTALPRTFKTIWRVLLRFTSDQALVARAPLIYSKSFDRGQFVSRIDSPGVAQMRLAGWHNPPELELVGIATAVEVVLRLAGRRDPEVTWRRVPGGATFTATWKT